MEYRRTNGIREANRSGYQADGLGQVGLADAGQTLLFGSNATHIRPCNWTAHDVWRSCNDTDDQDGANRTGGAVTQRTQAGAQVSSCVADSAHQIGHTIDRRP